MKRKFYELILFAFLSITATKTFAQTGNHVFSGAEMANFGIVDLSTPGGQTWSTDRTATPGYFSAIGTATYTGASDAANVNGYVKYYVNGSATTSFTYPVGSGTDLRSVTISGTLPGSGVYTTAWIAGDPSEESDPTGPNAGPHPRNSLGPGIAAVSPVGMWDWQDLSADAAGLNVSVSIPQVSGFSLAADLRLVGWDGTAWIDLSSTQGSGAGSDITENSQLTGTMVAGITAIAIGTIKEISMPVSLISFSALREAQAALLSWSTSEETNSDYFEIERSIDGKNWSTIGAVESGKESKTIRSYSFFDKSPVNGENLYRLKMVDQDETFAYSSIRSLTFDGQSINIFPNPASGYIQLKGIAVSDIQKVEIISQSGKTVYQSAPVSPVGIDVSKLPAGVYVMKIIGQNRSLNTQSLIIRH